MALNKTIQFRADSQEKDHLVKAAKDAGMSLSEYLRTVVLARTVVVVGEALGVVIVPATDSPTAQDQRVMAAVEGAIKTLNGQASSRAVGDDAARLDASPAPAQPDPESAGETSAVGTPAPVKPDVALSAPAPSGPASLVGDAALEPGGAGACPNCGGTNGQHQAFCESLTGEPPVEGTEQPAGPPEPEGRPIEAREDFLERRLGEGENVLVAEAEWRQITSSGQQPQMAACTNCGTMKSTAIPCPDCGAPAI